jgi:hypothetical protein
MSFGHSLHEQKGPPISAQQESFRLLLMADGTDADCKGDPLSMGF